MSESFNGFINSAGKNENIISKQPKSSTNHKIKKLVIVDDMNNCFILLSNNMFHSDCFLSKIKVTAFDKSLYENDILIKVGYVIRDEGRNEIASRIYTDIISPLHENQFIVRKENKEENNSEINIKVIEIILTGKTYPNVHDNDYKIVCNALTDNNDVHLINAITPIIKSDCSNTFVNQINFLFNRISYDNHFTDCNTINYTFDQNVDYNENPNTIRSLTFFNSEFYYTEEDISFYNVDGLIINSIFKASNIRNLNVTIKDMYISYSKLYCESYRFRHRLRNLTEINRNYYYVDRKRNMISLFNAKLNIYSDSQDPDGNGLEEDEEGYIYIDIADVIDVSNGTVCINGGSTSCYSTQRTNEGEYIADLSGMSELDDVQCFICLSPSKDHTVKYLGTISLFDRDKKLNKHDVHLYDRYAYKVIFIKYNSVNLQLDTLLSHLKRVDKKLYDLNKDIISGYSKAILNNKI